MKTAFLILGAQRSGTSVTSHMLSQFRVNFGNPKNFLQDAHNPIFFELKWVNDYNNKLIKALGYKYTEFFLPLEEDFERANTTELEKELHELIKAEWQRSPLIGIKDPRFSLTFPIWQKLLLEDGYQINIVFTFRHPSTFLESNKKLFHNWEGWTDTKHLNFWLQLNLAAIYFTRHFPVYFVSYDTLMKAPLEEAEKLAKFFNLNLDQAAKAALVVNNSYYHHKALTETGNPFVDYCYMLLCSQSLSPQDYLRYRNTALFL